MKPNFQDVVISILIIVISICVCSVVIFNIDTTTTNDKQLTGIQIYVQADGTTATAAKVAIYTGSGSLISTTAEKSLTPDAWNTFTFSPSVTINADNKEEYIFLVSANGPISLLSDGSDLIEQATTGYGIFPTTITGFESNTSKLTIYATYQ